MGFYDLIQNFKDNPKMILNLDSYSVYSIILESFNDAELQKIISENQLIFTQKLCREFNMFDCLSLMNLKNLDGYKEKTSQILKETIMTVFDNKTIIFLKKINDLALNHCLQKKNEIFNCVFKLLASFDSDKSSVIVYNLNLFADFNQELKNRFTVVEVLLTAYQKFDISLADGIYKGSSILGCLLRNDNQYLALDYVQDLLNIYNTTMDKIECIGGGSTSLVYKIGDSVLKLGETRNNRKILVHHRILASQIRKLVKNHDEDLFYVEVMKYIQNHGITQAECDELQEDLLRQGIIWEDAKIENCGLLNPDDENVSKLPLDYVEVMGIVENPPAREQFMKRERKVVVLDNDNMRLAPKWNWR